MPATRLTTKRVEKPWGRRDLWPGFEDVPEGGAPIGEVWFEVPGEKDGSSDGPELLIKYLFTSEKLSIQVHPDDAAAQAAGYARGKDEAWVILAAEPHASIALGTLQVMTRDELRKAAEDGSIEELMDWKAMKKDDFYYSPAGTVHAIGPGLTVVEIQQNVDLTYRIYDYGRPRELHLDAGIAVSEPIPYVATFRPHEIAPGRELLSDGPKIVIERWKNGASGTLRSDGRPLWLVPLAGKGRIGGEALEPGGAWLADGETPIALEEGIDLLVAYPGSGAIGTLIAV